eukprot:m51a1_g3023 hypothetical protein (259) ;mRNA; r:874831-875723
MVLADPEAARLAFYYAATRVHPASAAAAPRRPTRAKAAPRPCPPVVACCPSYLCGCCALGPSCPHLHEVAPLYGALGCSVPRSSAPVTPRAYVQSALRPRTPSVMSVEHAGGGGRGLKLNLLGGKIDARDCGPAHTAVRELHEETGRLLRESGALALYAGALRGPVVWVPSAKYALYVCEAPAAADDLPGLFAGLVSSGAAPLGVEAAELRWVALDEAARKDPAPGVPQLSLLASTVLRGGLVARAIAALGADAAHAV